MSYLVKSVQFCIVLWQIPLNLTKLISKPNRTCPSSKQYYANDDIHQCMHGNYRIAYARKFASQKLITRHVLISSGYWKKGLVFLTGL